MKYLLDQLLNRVSMYRLLSVALSALLGVALCLALFGLLPHSPLAMIASASVLILSAYGFNVLFGWLFGIKTHDESSYITALILFFLFNPSLEIAELSSLALVAMMAMGSKYVLAIRGRHIFNPAAIGAVIISLVGINYATWWVATPLLLPATLLFAFLILYKTRRLQLGLVFLGIAVPLIAVSSVLSGQTLLEAIMLLPSWPLLFFVGFMLSEPLTLPPRRWQRYTVGAIVAVLFALPIDVGSVSSTPAIALVIGNMVAYLLARRRHIQLTFKERRRLSTSSYEYVFDTKRPVNHIAGQYMEITVPHAHKDGRGIRRIFSIVNAPDDTTIRFGIKMYDRPSSFKKTLQQLEAGAIVDATSIGGDFILPKSSATPLLFIAGGIGITPFISHLLYLKRQDEHRDIVLIYSVSTIDDLAYVDSIKDSGIRVVVVTESNIRLPVAAWIHHNAQYLTKEDFVMYIPDVSRRSVYVSGPPQMVDATKSLLKRIGAKSITCDYFTGY